MNQLFLTFLPATPPLSLWWTLSLMCGIYFAHTGSLFILPFLIATISLCALSQKEHFVKKYCAPAAFFVLGLLSYQQRARLEMPIKELKNGALQATVTNKTFINHPFWCHRAQLHVHAIKVHTTWIKCSFPLYIYSKNRLYPRVKDTIECYNMDLKKTAEEEFKLYLLREGVAATCFTDRLYYKRLNRPSYSFVSWLFWQRELLQIKLRKKMNRQTYTFFSSLFMGNRPAVKTHLEQYKQHFKTWGIIHHLARSGLHLVIFIMIWHFLLNFFPGSFLVKHLITLCITGTYLLFSWSSLSFLRALFVYLFYKSAALFRVKLHPLHAISTTCIALLLHNPMHLFFLDFQLSFLLSFCLLWIAHLHHQRTISQEKSVAHKAQTSLS